jgi:hypothetical protein
LEVGGSCHHAGHPLDKASVDETYRRSCLQRLDDQGVELACPVTVHQHARGLSSKEGKPPLAGRVDPPKLRKAVAYLVEDTQRVGALAIQVR